MANQITGRIERIGEIVTIPSKDGSKTYQKREVVLDATRFDPYTGERGFENYPSFEFSGDKCVELNSYSVGQVVTISFELQGVKYTDKDNTTKYFTRVRAYRIEARQQAPQPQGSVPAQPAPQIPQQAQPQPQPQPIVNDMDQLPF